MHPLLQKALEKLGLKSYNELNELERDTFKQWETMLRGRKITQDDVVADIREFQETILTKLEDPTQQESVKNYLLAQLSIVRYILRTIDSPQADIKKVEQEINNLG